jgi:S1-C subfamily serine protease
LSGHGFFINSSGVFITAKHVLYNEKNKMFEMILGVCALSTGRIVSRPISYLCVHNTADIAIGKFENKAYDGNAIEVEYESAPGFILSFKLLEQHDEIISFAYPRVGKDTVDTKTTFNINGIWTSGIVKEYCPGGGFLLQNRCYRTSMLIESGASGGPVFKDSQVVGINSTGWDLEPGGEPLSYITPIDYIYDLQIESENGQIVTVRELVEQNSIQTK